MIKCRWRVFMESKSEIIKGLYDLRANLIDRRLSYELKLSVLNSEIKDINSKICEYVGHDYSDWMESSSYGGFRICNRCNSTEFKKARTLEKK